MFIALEGIDACGKTTQAQMLAERMGAMPYKFPDANTPIGKLIYAHLHREWRAEPDADGMINAMVFQSLQIANRMEHAAAIAQAQRLGHHLVTDRWWASGVVYGGEDGLNSQHLIAMHEHLPKADLHLLLDVEARISAERRPERRDRYEQRPGLMSALVKRYRQLWKLMAERDVNGKHTWVIIDASTQPGQTHKAIMDAVRIARAKKGI